MSKQVLVVIPVEERHKEYLERMGAGCQFTYASPETVTEEQLAKAQVIIGNVSPAQLAEAPNLEWIQLNSAGSDTFCKPGVLKEGTLLTNATGAYGLAISEHMLGMSLMMLKHLGEYYRHQLNHEWISEGKVGSIWNSTTLVIGLGDIGGEYAKRMKMLGSYTIGLRRTVGEKPDYLDEVYTTDHIDEVLPRADFVLLSLPNTPATYHIMDERRMRLMKQKAFLLNAGRGEAIDGEALNRVLRNGWLGGCATDVTEPEPLPADSPLWDAPRMYITPHISGKFNLQETFERIVRIAGGNLEKFLAGEKDGMKNLVDFKTGYRKR